MKKLLKKLTKKTTFTILALIIIGAPLLYLTLLNSKKALAAPWSTNHTSWMQRKQLTLVNNSGSTINTSVPYQVNIDTKSFFNASRDGILGNCDDLRVVYQPDNSTNTEVSRSVAYAQGATNCRDSSSTIVTFPLQAAITNGSSSSSYYIYYANPGSPAYSASTSLSAYNINGKTATFVAPFNGTTTALAAGSGTPTTATGAIRYSGGKSALSFNGLGDYVSAGNGSSLNNIPAGGQFTVETWAKDNGFTTDPGWHFYADKRGGSGTAGWSLYSYRTGSSVYLTFEIGNDSTSFTTSTLASTLADGAWHHIAVTYSDSGTRQGRLWLDGQELTPYGSQQSTTGTLADDSAKSLNLGVQASGNYAKAILDEFRISNIVRYTSNFTPQTSPFVRDSNTRVLLHFDENGDDPRNTGKAIDDSGNGNHGTITGAKYVAGLTGVDGSAEIGYQSAQSYAAHGGVFIEEGTTNKITNPSFENATYNTNWTTSNVTPTQNTTASYNKFGANSVRLVGPAITTATNYSESNANASTWLYADGTTHKRLGQGIQVGSNSTINTAALYLHRSNNNSSYFSVELQTDNAGVPSGTPVTNGTSNCVAMSSISYEVNEYQYFVFTAPVSLTASTQYHLVLKGFSDSACTTELSSYINGTLDWANQVNGGGYAGGVYEYMNEAGTWSNTATSDFIFALYTSGPNTYTTSINVGNTSGHALSAYVYDGTSGNIGGTINSSIAYLMFNGQPLQTTYTNLGGGWWKLASIAAGIASSQSFGISVGSSKTIYVDGFQLEQQDYSTTYADGSLGSSYAWTGAANNSTSTRTNTKLDYSATNNISATAGTISFWAWLPTYKDGCVDHLSMVNSSSDWAGTGSIHFGKNCGAFGLYTAASVGIAGGSFTYGQGKWHHFVGTWSNTGTTLTLYIDGTQQATTTTNPQQITDLSSISLGQSSNNPPNGIGMVMSDLRIYSAELTPTDVTDLYNTGLGSHSEGPQLERNSPVLQWSFDEGSGTTAKDSSIKTNNGTISGATYNTDTPYKQSTHSLKFDGSNDYVSKSYSFDSELDPGTDSFAVSGWFKHPSASSGQDTLISRADGVNGVGYKIYMNSSGYICFGTDGTAGSFPADSACSTTSYADSKWYFVEGVKDNPNNKIILYINGNQITQTTLTDANSLSGSSPTFYVGIDADGTSNPWDGFIDDVKYYGQIRSAAQVKTDFNAYGPLKGVGTVLGTSTDPLNSGLVGYWKMDETSGTLADSSGNGSTGTWAGTGASHYTTGKFGNGGGFNGTDDVVSASNSNLAASQITASAWIYENSGTSGSKYILSAGVSENADGYGMYIGGGSSSCRDIVFTTNNSYTHSTACSISQGVWHLITIVYDGTNKKIYIDGKLDTSVAATPTFTNTTLTIGNEVSAYWFAGTIDETRIYNRALSPKEVSDLYNFAPGPVGYWNFEEGSGGSVNDTSGNANTGTWYGTGSHWTNGKYGKAGNFNGTDDYVGAGSGSSLDKLISGGVTWEWWEYYSSNDANTKIILQKRDSPNTGWMITQSRLGTQVLNVTIDTDTQDARIDTSPGLIPANQWNHIAVVYDNTASSRIAKVFINGTEASYDTQTAATGTVIDDSSQNLLISNSSSDFNGKLDEVKVYNYARTQKQIVSDMLGSPKPVGGGGNAGTSAPLIYLDFDEGYSTVANNLGNGGSSLNGTLTSMATAPSTTTSGWTQAGKFGKALNFDGINDVVNFGNNSSLNLSLPFSISLWIKRANTDTGVFLDKTNSYWAMFNGNNIRFSFNNGTNCDSTTSTSFSSTTQWYHLVGTYESGSQKIYVNGVLQPLSEGGNCTGTVTTNSNNLGIGAPNPTWPFAGSIDEVKIYNYSLTADEIKTEYNRGSSMVLGALGNNSTYAAGAANQEYCVPGDSPSTSCAAPVGEWKFEEGSGGSVNDTSGNANTGTWAGSANHWTTGKVGKTGNFSQGTDYVNLSASNNFPSTANAPWTVEAWFNPSTFNNDPFIFSYGTGNTGDTPHLVIVSNKIRAACWGGGSNVDGSTLSLNTWYHVAGVYDGTNITLYLNGKLDAGPTSIITCTPSLTNPTIGGPPGGGGNSFGGKIDEAKIYNYARTPAQIAWDYNKGKPVGYWDFDECSGTTLHDLSGNSYSGTITIGAGGTSSVGTCTTASTAWGNGATGKRNASLNLDGTDDYAVLNNDLNVNNWYSISVSAWINPSQISAWASQIISKDNSADMGASSSNFNIGIDGTGHPNFHIAGGGSSTTITSSKTISTNQWSHIVGVWNGANMYLYLNGVQVANGTQDGPMHNACASLSFGTWGCGSVGTQGLLVGQIDEAKIWNYALTATQVKNEYNNGAVFFGPLTGSP